MSNEILRKLANIFANQNKVLKKLSQGLTQEESIFLAKLEKAKKTSAWENASEDERRDFESDLRESIKALMSENIMMDEPDDLG